MFSASLFLAPIYPSSGLREYSPFYFKYDEKLTEIGFHERGNSRRIKRNVLRVSYLLVDVDVCCLEKVLFDEEINEEKDFDGFNFFYHPV